MNKTKKFSRNQVWENYLQLLITYKKKNGHVIVPVKIPLGRWLQRQRRGWDQLSKSQQKKLNNVDQHTKDLNEVLLWQKSFNELLDYQKSHGDINVRNADSNNKNLYRWILAQRRNNKEYLNEIKNWTSTRIEIWKNRRLRLIEAFNFTFKDASSLESEKEDVEEEIRRLVRQHVKKHGMNIVDTLEEWRKQEEKNEYIKSKEQEEAIKYQTKCEEEQNTRSMDFLDLAEHEDYLQIEV
jgi:hypothetical protein